jgi:hypothetical protein
MSKVILIFLCILSVSLEAKIQWADSVVAVSASTVTKEGSPFQVLGEPSICSDFGRSECAWSIPAKTLNKSLHWIVVSFDTAIYVKTIFVHENFFPGAISKIELLDATMSRADIAYQNGNPVPLSEKGQIFKQSVTSSNFPVKFLKLYVNNYNFSSYQAGQIDAIGISAEDEDYYVDINLPKDLNFPEYPQNLGEAVNSPYSEVTVVIAPDGKTLYFSRKAHPQNIEGDKAMSSQDIWYSEIDSVGHFLPAKNIGSPLNNSEPNFPISSGTDGKSLIVANKYQEDGTVSTGFSKSYYDGKQWSFPESFSVTNYYNLDKRGSYSMGADGKTFILSIKREDSFGNKDLYV